MDMEKNSYQLGILVGRDFPSSKPLFMIGILLFVNPKSFVPVYREADEEKKKEMAKECFSLYASFLIKNLPSGILAAIALDMESFVRGFCRGLESMLGKDPIEITKETLDLLARESILRDPEEARAELVARLAEEEGKNCGHL